MSDLVKKTFYITNLFSDIKTTSWSTNELKTVIFLLKKLSEHRIYIPDLGQPDDLDMDDFYKEVSKVPLEYKIKRDEFSNITNVKRNHIAREINKVRKSLGKRTINTPHPIELDGDSGETIPWFSKITYSNQSGELNFIFNNFAIERLVAFVKYTKICFEKLVKLDSAYSVYMYIFFKIMKDSSYQKSNSVLISVDELKEKLGLSNKYTVFKNFRLKVIDVIVSEINDVTDLNLEYALIKEGRAYSKINFKFDYKSEYIDAESTNKNNSELLNFDIKSIKSPFEQIFKSWGINRNKIKDIENTYSLNSISNAIQITKDAIETESIKKSPASFFLGTLDNKQLQEEVDFAKVQEKLKKEQEEQEKKALASEYNAIQKFINDNSDEISNFLSVKSAGGIFELSLNVSEELANISCIDIEKYKIFRPKFAVLDQGYFDMKQKKEIRPNMYSFLNLIKTYL
jgi:plasmid replication initiation protein